MRCKRGLSISERIEQHIISKNGCWITDFDISHVGYPLITINRKTRSVHRLMFELHKGEIPDKMFVCHTCDNRKCINPDHLFLGTNQDNMNDMIKKGCKASTKGSQNGRAKLDENM